MDLSKLSDSDLKELKHQLEFSIAKYDTIQNARKTAMNSAYGALGNKYFRFFDVRLAESITITGQFVFKNLEKRLNGFLNDFLKTEGVDYVIGGDTDSAFLNISGIINKAIPSDKQKNVDMVINFMNKVCVEMIQPVIDNSCTYIKDSLNAVEQTLYIKREVLSDVAIWTTKKRYVMSMRDKENVRYAEPKLKIVGLEAIKSSTPAKCREKIKECIKTIFYKDEAALQEEIREFRKLFETFQIEDIASPTSVNGLKKYSGNSTIYIKGSPGHVKASLAFNYHIKRLGIDKIYEAIGEGDKVKTVYLKSPNPLNEEAIAFSDKLPEEFDVLGAIDMDAMFEKTFLKPLTMLLDVIGWKSEKQKDLMDFFE